MGLTEGAREGCKLIVGAGDGTGVGRGVGLTEGGRLGLADNVGCRVGSAVGLREGAMEEDGCDDVVGIADIEGEKEGISVRVGPRDGLAEGGPVVGSKVGEATAASMKITGPRINGAFVGRLG